MLALVGRNAFVCRAAVGAHTEFVNDIRAKRYQPREKRTINFNPSTKARFCEVLNRPELVLPSSDCSLHHAIAFGSSGWRLNGDSLPHPSCGDGALERNYAWLLVCFESYLFAFVTRLA